MAIKTINGIVVASIKTVNGIAVASVKTWGGETWPAAATAYRYWQQGAANNGRPYWDLANTSSGTVPTGTLAPSASDWGFMVDRGTAGDWATVVFTFSQGNPASIGQFIASPTTDGAKYSTGSGVAAGSTLTYTKATWSSTGSVGSDPGTVNNARYFGFGMGNAGLTFAISSVAFT